MSVQEAIASLPVPEEWTWRVVVRPKRRTMGIEIDRSGGVLFAVPADADPAAVAEAVRARLPRLTAEVRRRQRRAPEPVKQLVGGTSFSYLGRRYRLRLVEETPTCGVRLRYGWLELPRFRHAAAGGQAITDWYVTRGNSWLAARVPPLAARLGVTPESVRVTDLGECWGACAPDGRITVHWAVMQLPPGLVDYVLVHELAHLRVPGHGGAFHRQVRLALPDAEARADRFASEEPALWRGAVAGRHIPAEEESASAPPRPGRGRVNR